MFSWDDSFSFGAEGVQRSGAAFFGMWWPDRVMPKDEREGHACGTTDRHHFCTR